MTYKNIITLSNKTVIEQQLRLTLETKMTTEVWLEQQIKVLEATKFAVLKEGLNKRLNILNLLEMAIRAGNFSDVYLGLTTGEIVDGAGWIPPEGYDTRVRPWYKTAVEKGKTTFSRPYVDLTTMSLVTALVSPMYENGKLSGVISADIILDTLNDIIGNVKVGKTGYSFIIDKDGTLIVYPNVKLVFSNKIQNISPLLSEFVKMSGTNKSGTYEYTDNGTDMLLSFYMIDNTDWFLCSILPKSEAHAFSKNTTVLYTTEILLKILGILAIVSILGVGGSMAVIYFSNKNFENTVSKQQEELSDISEDLKTEIMKRRKFEEYYQTLFNVANDGIILGNGLICVDCNNKSSEIFGKPKSSILGISLLELSAYYQSDGKKSSDRINNLLERALKGNQEFFTWNFMNNDNMIFPAEVGMKGVEINNETLILYSIRDISKRVNAENQLRQAQKLAAMGEMMGAIAHQWRQPLNILATYIASLKSAQYFGEISNDFLKEFTDKSTDQIQFMSKTIDDFRNFFKPSKTKSDFRLFESLDIAFKLIEPKIKQESIQLLKTFDLADKNLMVSGYQGEFIHAIINIIANAVEAIKFSGEKNESVKKQISVTLFNLNKNLNLVITDTGGGIPEKYIGDIFNPYFSTKGNATGMGLGLYMAKMIIEEEMKGKIFAKNTDTGAQITIQIPIAEYGENNGLQK